MGDFLIDFWFPPAIWILRGHKFFCFCLLFIYLVQAYWWICKWSWSQGALPIQWQGKALSLLRRSDLASTFSLPIKSEIVCSTFQTLLALLCRNRCSLQDCVRLVVWFVDTEFLLRWGFNCAILRCTINHTKWSYLEVDGREIASFLADQSVLFTLELHQSVLAGVMWVFFLPHTSLGLRIRAVDSQFAIILIGW